MSALATLAFLLVAAAGPTAPQSERIVDAPLPSAKLYRLHHSFGPCIVQPAAAGQPPSARLELVASGGSGTLETRYLELCGLQVERGEGERCELRSTFPPAEQKAQELSFAATLRVLLPPDCSLELDLRFGAATVTGPFRGATIRSKLGSVLVAEVRGDVEVVGEYGAIAVRDLGGGAKLHNKSASITAERVAGHVDARTSGDKIVIDDAGSAHAENRIQPIELRRVRGDARAIAPFSAVTASDIGGDLTIDGQNQPIRVERVARHLIVRNKSGAVEAQMIGGNATLLGSLSALTLSDVTGDVEARSPNAPLKLSRIGGRVVAENSAFAIDLVDLRGDVAAQASGGLLRARFGELAGTAPRTIVLEAVGGGIELELPAAASAELELTSSSGQLDAPLPGIQITQSGSARIGTLTLGAGNAKLRATTVGGPLRVRLGGS